MSADGNAVDLDARSFNLESVEIVDDDVDVSNELICEDRVGVDVNVEVNIDGDRNDVDVAPLPHIDEEKKRDFERRRDEILSCVPAEVKARFGEIYFSTFGKFVGPVLIMNPYKVEPGPLRDQWLTMFRNCQKNGRETQMTHLTYWYGQFNDLPSAYSFQKTSQLLSYEKGTERTEKKLKTFRHKHGTGKKLTSKDINFMKGFEEMEIDRTKDPSERYGYIDSNFSEEYHILFGEEEDKVKEDKQKSKNENKSEIKNGKRKKKEIKKLKVSTQTEKQMTADLGSLVVVENGGRPKSKKKISKKRIKESNSLIETTRSKKRVKHIECDGQDLEIPEKPMEGNFEQENGIHPKDDTMVKEDIDTIGGSTRIEDIKPSADKEFAELGEVSSHGETDDGSLKIDNLKSDDDSADEDYVEKPKAKESMKKRQTKKEKIRGRETKSEKTPKKKIQETKVKIENSAVRGGGNVAADFNLKKKILRREQRKFHKCEIDFLPLLRRWEKAINEKNVAQLSSIFEELLTSMERFTAPFIEEYGMSDLMKRSKGYDNERRKKVLTKFKTIYKEMKNEVPEGFKARKESEKYVPVEVNTEIVVEETEHSNPSKSSTDVSYTPQDTTIPIIPSSSRKCQNTPHVMLGHSTQIQTKQDINIEPSSQKQNVSSVKHEKRKKFSLGKLMRAGSSSQPSRAGSKAPSSCGESSVVSCRSSKNYRNNPSWIMEVVSKGEGMNENRKFGLEFLQQASLYIPENKTMNYEAVARNIEIAIYDWSRENVVSKSEKHRDESEGSWLDKYWNKIHDLAACISGKHQEGTLAQMICDGKFASPNELVCLHDDDLLCSFEGSSLSTY